MAAVGCFVQEFGQRCGLQLVCMTAGGADEVERVVRVIGVVDGDGCLICDAEDIAG